MDFFQILAGILLIGRLIAVRYLFTTLKVQIALLRLPIEPEVWDFRKKLHYMTVALLIGNFPPIVLDLAVLWGVERTAPYLVVYTLSNMITMVIAAIMIDKMYRLANQADLVNELEKEHMRSTSKKELDKEKLKNK